LAAENRLAICRIGPIRFRHTLATDILARGGAMADVADVLGISEHIARRRYAKRSAARQGRISAIMRLVHGGEAAAAGTPPPQRAYSPTCATLRPSNPKSG
jgi:hypothetical protein